MKTTAEKFNKYADMLRDWSGRMNLVARGTLNDIETRHFADSAQLADTLPPCAKIIDLGSGAGFPAVVLAILGFDVIAIESIGKKANFLNALKTELDLPNLTIYHGRVEEFMKTNFPAKTTKNIKKAGKNFKNGRNPGLLKKAPGKNDKNGQKCRENDTENEIIFTARAFAPLVRILDYVFPAKCRCFLLKGREIESEIATAKLKYNFNYELTPSKTGDGYIVIIDNL